MHTDIGPHYTCQKSQCVLRRMHHEHHQIVTKEMLAALALQEGMQVQAPQTVQENVNVTALQNDTKQ